MAGVDQLLEHAGEALLGDLEDVQQFGHREARRSVDEVQNPVMRAPEAVVGKNGVGIGREVPVGEEEELDDGEVDALLQVHAGPDRACGCGSAFSHGGSDVLKFMSALLT